MLWGATNLTIKNGRGLAQLNTTASQFRSAEKNYLCLLFSNKCPMRDYGFEVAVVVMRNPDVTCSPWFVRPLQGAPLTNELEIMT